VRDWRRRRRLAERFRHQALLTPPAAGALVFDLSGPGLGWGSSCCPSIESRPDTTICIGESA